MKIHVYHTDNTNYDAPLEGAGSIARRKDAPVDRMVFQADNGYTITVKPCYVSSVDPCFVIDWQAVPVHDKTGVYGHPAISHNVKEAVEKSIYLTTW